MKTHKFAKHGVDLVWLSCDQDNCEYRAKKVHHPKRHKENIHNIGGVGTAAIKKIATSKQSEQTTSKYTNRMPTTLLCRWFRCGFKSKRAGNLKQHKKVMHTKEYVIAQL